MKGKPSEAIDEPSGLQVHLPQQSLKGRVRSQAIVGRRTLECCHKERITLFDTPCDPLQALVQFSHAIWAHARADEGT